MRLKMEAAHEALATESYLLIAFMCTGVRGNVLKQFHDLCTNESALQYLGHRIEPSRIVLACVLAHRAPMLASI